MAIIPSSLRSWLTGLTISQEYVCLTDEKLHRDLTVQLYDQSINEFADVTAHHFFLGYKPLIIAFAFEDKDRAKELFRGQALLNFQSNHLNGERVAQLELQLNNKVEVENYSIAFYTGRLGKHSFINPVRQWINNLLEKRKNKKQGNVGLDGNLYDQVRIAYAVPRVISLITVSDGSQMNLFPTDLHGSLNDYFYFDSLRIEGKANAQVERLRKMVITEIQSSEYKLAYNLGKNHMSDLKEPENFPLGNLKSKVFQFPLPAGAISYRELEWLNSWNIGIHRIHLFKIIHSERINEGNRLTHVHQYYAQWRNDLKIKSNYLFR